MGTRSELVERLAARACGRIVRAAVEDHGVLLSASIEALIFDTIADELGRSVATPEETRRIVNAAWDAGLQPDQVDE